MPTHDENASPWPLCENLLAKPCRPPLCARRPVRIPMSGFAPLDVSAFPLTALSIESSNPIILMLLFGLCLLVSQRKVSERNRHKQVKFRSQTRTYLLIARRLIIPVISSAKLHLLSIVKAAVVHREPATSMLGIDLGETFAETDIAPAVILLSLNRGGNDRIDSDH